LRFIESEESATSCSSFSTNCGITSDAAVDDDAGVEDLIAAFGTYRAEQADEPCRLEPLAMPAAEDEPQIRQDDEDETVKKRDAAVACVCPKQPGAYRSRDEQAGRAAEERAQNVRDGGFAQSPLERDDQRGECERKRDVGRSAEGERLQQGGGVGDGGEE
jgi:hypothetical protein